MTMDVNLLLSGFLIVGVTSRILTLRYHWEMTKFFYEVQPNESKY